MSPPEAFQTVPLCNEDAAAIYDLRMAYRNSLEVNGDSDVSRHHANLSDLVNIAELSVRRVIAMAKQVPAFRALPQVCLFTVEQWRFYVGARGHCLPPKSCPGPLLQAGNPSGEGSATRVLRLHSAVFSTSIRSSRKSSMLHFTTPSPPPHPQKNFFSSVI